jgi:capsular exopolysaccharide synthesis family protein
MENSIVSQRMSALSGESHPDPGTAISHTRFEPYKKWHRALRGRYPLVLTLSAICAITGAIVGFRIPSAQYRSEGLIQIAYTLPAVMQRTDQNEPLQMYEEFLQSQVLLAGSREVITDVLDSPDWKQTPGSYNSVESFASNLVVDNPSHSQALRVAFLSQKPEVAAAGARGVVNAYIKRYGSHDAQEDAQRMKVLNDRKAAIKAEMKQVVDDMIANAQPVNNNQIAMVDETMRGYLKQETDLQKERAQMMGALGSNHPAMVEMKQTIDFLQQRMDQYAADYLQMQLSTAEIPSGVIGTRAALPQQQKVQLSLEDLNTDVESIDRRIDTLQTEASLGPRRYSVLSEGAIPTTTFKDRRALCAVMGLLGGAFFPAACFIGVGLTRRRYRFSDDIRSTATMPLLGILPRLSKISDPHLVGVAAHCIHNLRIRLQLLNHSQPHKVFMVTSGASGEGKSSLTLSVGLSFAAAGARTLLIDADMIGRGLTFRTHNADSPGLMEYLKTKRLQYGPCIADDLWILPIGQSNDMAPMPVSPKALQKLIADVREDFDYILIDTGPVLCSLEAPMVAPYVDDVILVVSRHQEEQMIERSVQALHEVGANVAGYVFNYAHTSDFRHSSYAKSYRSADSSAAKPIRVAVEVAHKHALDPLASCVACFTQNDVEGSAK